MAFRPQTLEDAWNVVGRVAKYCNKKAMQQDIINTARKNLPKQGIQEFEFFLSESKPKGNIEEIKKARRRTLVLILLVNVVAKLRALRIALKTKTAG